MRRTRERLAIWWISRERFHFDIDAGFLGGAIGAVYAAVLGYIKGGSVGAVSGWELVLLAAAFGAIGLVVGSVIAGRPDFGPNLRSAMVRGWVATIPLYAAGGLLFLAPEHWFSVLPVTTLIAATLVGPPIGIFMYRLHRRVDPVHDTVRDESVRLAWLKGELLAGWTPLLVSIALLAAFGITVQVLPIQELAPRRPAPTPSLMQLRERLPAMLQAAVNDSTDPAAHYELGVALSSLGNFSEAMEHLRTAVRHDTTRVEYWVRLARAAFYGKQPSVTLEAYFNALRLDASALGRTGLDRRIWEAALTLTLQEVQLEAESGTEY